MECVSPALHHGLAPSSNRSYCPDTCIIGAISAIGFAFYGSILCYIGDSEGGYEYGSLALSILDRFNHVRSEWYCRVGATFYAYVAPCKEPWDKSLPQLYEASRFGIISGDYQHAMIGLVSFCNQSFVAGTTSLPDLEIAVRQSMHSMEIYKQDFSQSFLSYVFEAILRLQGKNDDPVVIDSVLKKETDSHANEILSVAWNLTVNYILGDLDAALETAEKCRSIRKSGRKLNFPNLQHQNFYAAMIYLEAARKFPGRRRGLLPLARQFFRGLQKAAVCNSHNYLYQVQLIEAEMATLTGNLDNAKAKYLTAMATAKEENALHILAMANERFALFLKGSGPDHVADEYFDRAKSLYKEWGAGAKVELMNHSTKS
jgi:hypothetical protein